MASLRAARPSPDSLTVAATAGAMLIAAGVGALIALKPALGIGAIAAGVYALAAATSLPRALALCVPSFFFPFFTVGNVWLKGGLALVGFAVLGTVVAQRAQVKALAVAHGRLLLLALAFGTWLGLSILWSPEPASALSEWFKVLLCLGVLLAVLVAIQRWADARLALGAFVGGGILSAVFGLVGSPTGTTGNPDAAASIEAAGRITAGSGDPNVLAASLVATAVLAVCMAILARGPLRAGLAVGALLCVMGVAATQSRGGLIATAFAIVLSLFVFRRNLRQVLPVATIALGALVLYFATVPNGFDRVTDFEDEGYGRTELWLVGWRAFGDQPVAGIGLNQFRVDSSRYVLEPGTLKFVQVISERPLVVHNTYLQSLAETGVIGFALYMSIIAVCLTAAFRAARAFDRVGAVEEATMTRAVIVALGALMAAGFFFSAGVDYKTWLLLGLGPALLLIAQGRSAARPRPRTTAARA